MIKLMSLLSAILLLCQFSSYGQVELSGRVYRADTQEGLSAATVSTGKAGVSTDEQGYFQLRTAADSLLVSYVGYQTLTLAVPSDNAFLDIPLQPAGSLKAVTVQARPWAVSLRQPLAFTRLDQAALQLNDGIRYDQVLNQVPGVFMQSAALNTNRISIRGIGNRSPFGTAKIRAYFDEIPLTNGVGETVLEDIDLEALESIEVRRGPTASAYGAGLGGMIHLRSAALKEEVPKLGLRQQFGSFGQVRTVGAASYGSEQLQLRATYSDTHSDGFRQNNTYDRQSAFLVGKSQSGDRHKSTALVYFNQVKAFIPSSLRLDDFRQNPRQAAFTWAQVGGFEDYDKLLIGLSHRYQWTAPEAPRSISTTLSLFNTQRQNYEVRPFNILRENNRGLGFRLLNTLQPAEQDALLPRVEVGMEFFQERYAFTTNQVTEDGGLDTLLSDNLEYRQYYNIFAKASWRWRQRWRLTAGLNVNDTRYRLQDRYPDDQEDISGAYAFKPIVSPQLTLSYEFAERKLLFANLSHGFSAPTVEETLNPDGSLNPGIQPERGWNLSVGTRGNFVAGWLSYDIVLYQMWVDDLLVARRTALDQFVGVNAGRTIHRGVEAQIFTRLHRQLRAVLNYTYSDHSFDRFRDGEEDFSGNQLTGSPPHRISSRLEWDHPQGFFGRLQYDYTDSYPVNDANTVYNAAYQVLALKAGWQGRLISRLSLQVYAGVQNLTDTDYASMVQVNAQGFGGNAPRYYYPGRPRNYYGAVRLEWKLESE